jgi:hypothetical protein
MDESIKRTLSTPEECEQFAINVEARGKPELAIEARRLAIELRAAAHGARTTAEREALEAVYAYERAMSVLKGKKTRASRTWQMIERRGIIPAVEVVVSRPAESAGYTTLVKMGLEKMAFEAVVLRHPEVFSSDAVSRSKERLQDWARR